MASTLGMWKMKKHIVLFALFLYAMPVFSAETNSATMKLGDGIGRHTQDMKVYQKVNQPTEKLPGRIASELARWKVGDGILSVTHSMGVGIIEDMTYTIPADGDKRVVLKVKEFDPKTGELTVLIPNNPSEATGSDRGHR